MALFLSFFFFLFILPLSYCARISSQFLYPNFSFTPFNFVENSGKFLSSPNSTFFASFHSIGRQNSRYYLYLVYSPSTSVVWAANPDSPVPETATLSLSFSALSLSYPNGSIAWSTPRLSSPIYSLQLLDSGNLLLLDALNATLWQSFDHPTDTLLPTQQLKVGSYLSSSVTDSDLSDSEYHLFVTANDSVMRWRGLQQYWSLASDKKSLKDYSTQAAYMEINGTGLYLLDGNNRVVYRVVLPVTNGFRIGKLDYNGQFRIFTYDPTDSSDSDFIAPSDNCDLPFACNTLGLCPAGSNVTCNCPGSFGPAKGGGCTPIDGSALPSSSACVGSSSISYLNLGYGVSYFANKFANPINGEDFSSCQDSCSRNCSCLGFFYRNSSMACYLLQNQLGSLIQTKSSTTAFGYIKTIKSSSSSSPSLPNSTNKSSTNIVPILLPLIAALLLLLVLSFVGFQWWRKRNKKNTLLVRVKTPLREIKLGHHSSSMEGDLSDNDDDVSIPGLPSRFTYDELASATDNFNTLIGSGGFGSVYKGELTDKSLIAVKKITHIGIQGKREFCTEIVVIGKIHHVNLVKLRGYCAQGSNRLLVYEYMNRGSLDRPLFGPGPVLEWQERMEIAIGAARGLSYLHSGCDHKILHCDIKPENILLADHGQVKIADFGMAKLMTPEQSGLFTTMRGTRGYLAPEWLTNSAISDKTDVYSYGMVLLEIIRGRKNRYDSSNAESEFSNSSSGSQTVYFPIVAVEKHIEGKWLELVDPRMERRVSETEVERAVKVALCCLHEEPWMRPSMTTVVGMLEGGMAAWDPKVEGLKFLRLYGRGSGGPTEAAVGLGGNFTGSGSSTAVSPSASLLTFISSQEVSGPR